MPPLESLLAANWEEAIKKWPELLEKTTVLVTEPERPRGQKGPLRVVGVRKTGADDRWQIIVAPEYW